VDLRSCGVLSGETVSYHRRTKLCRFTRNSKDRYSRSLSTLIHVVLTSFVIIGISIVYVSSGLLRLERGLYTPLLVVIQLYGSAYVVMFLDQVLDNYGMTSSVTLFIAMNTCRAVFWQALSPVMKNLGRGPEFEGALVSFAHLSFTWKNKMLLVKESLFRQSNPNLVTLATSIVVFVAIIYLQGWSSTRSI
jgi:protein transport protein SEC61 subunit alpha